MDFTVKIEGLAGLGKESQRVLNSVQAELERGLLASAQRVERQAKDLIRKGPKTGRVYRRGGRVHRASAPGEPPAADTGRLMNSISSYLEKGALYSFVVAGRGVVKYARMLEFGTAKMAARPFMVPAFEMQRRWIEERLKTAVEMGIRKAKKK